MKTTLVAVVLCAIIYQVAGVEKCYTCKNLECSEDQETTCKANDEDTKSYICQYTELNGDDAQLISKSCQEDTATVKSACSSIDEIDGQICYTCNEDLCNKNSAGIFTVSALLLAVLALITTNFA